MRTRLLISIIGVAAIWATLGYSAAQAGAAGLQPLANAATPAPHANAAALAQRAGAVRLARQADTRALAQRAYIGTPAPRANAAAAAPHANTGTPAPHANAATLAQRASASAQTRARTLIAAHRGSSAHAPENTLSSVLRADADGADIAEIDVQLTADGAVVLYHDESLRAHGLDRRVDELPFAQLAALDIGFRFRRDYEGESIPQLREVIAAARDRIRLNIELKPYGDVRALANAVASIVTAERFVEQCLVTSFDLEAIAYIKSINPAIRTGLIASSPAAVTPELLAGNVDAVSMKSRAVNRRLVLRLRRHGKELHVWTVNDEREMQRMLRLGVTSILTDDPPKLRALMLREKAR